VSNIFGDPERLVDAIQDMHQLCVPPSAIAKRLHLTERDVRHAIQRGRLPVRELPLHWETIDQPAPGRESER